MAKPSLEAMAEWEAWLGTRPEAVVAMARRFPPWKMYRLTTTGQHAAIVSYLEMDDGTIGLRAICWREELPALTAVNVYGLKPDDLQEVPDGRHN